MSYELYEFNRGGSAWYYTNGLDSITFGGHTYSPEIISYGRINITEEVYKSPITISISTSSAVVVDLVNTFNPYSCTLRIWRDDSLWWAGRVVLHSIKSSNTELQCESIYSSVKRIGVRNKFERLCRYNLYSTDCGVDKSLYAVINAEVTVVSGRDLTIPGVAGTDATYKLGMILFGGKYTTVLKRVSDVFTVTNQIGISNGDHVTIYRGCNHTTDDCLNQFDNIINFGGFPFLPPSNIFEVGIV